MDDTIFAVSSGMPPAAIAVLRLSGPDALSAARALARTLPPARRAALRALYASDGTLLDRALVLIFPGPQSATGEDLVELHLHGGRAVVRAVEDALAAIPGLRAAEPGEFTRRALANGRIDLTEAEGLGDLLTAQTETQRRAAIGASEGGVRRMVEQWGADLIALAAQVEALLDHADEDDVVSGASGVEALRARATALSDRIGAALANPPVERLRDGIHVVLAGPPNAGKSTLLNALVGREAAIASPIAGTTRDRIEVPVVRGGIAWIFTDTAGLAAETADPIERIGIDRARGAMAVADVILWLGEGSAPQSAAPIIALAPKADLGAPPPEGRLPVSAVSGEGIALLWRALEDQSRTLLPRLDRTVFNARQHDLAGDVQRGIGRGAAQQDLILMAEDFRSAMRALDRITGRAGVEDLLDSLFSRFCIGK